jgi:transcription elongation factor/antiterminator RfaH
MQNETRTRRNAPCIRVSRNSRSGNIWHLAKDAERIGMPLDRAAVPLDCALCPGERWYAVYTLPHRESTAQIHLENQGFRTFMPLHSKTTRHARKYQTILAPLFLRYLFIVLDLGRDRWRLVNGTRGVATLIMQDEMPAPVKSGVVETLVASSTADGEVQFCSEMEPGRPVRLVAGPFVGQLGILKRLSNSGRIEVLLEMMGGRVPTELHTHKIVPLV